MPNGEDGAGNACHGKRRERCRRKACRKSGILHADFDGKRFSFGRREVQQLSKPESAAVAEQVMENHDSEHDGTRGENLRGVVRNDSSHNHRNRNHGNERQNFDSPRSPLAEKLVDDESERDRHDDDLHYGKEHRHHIHVHCRTQEQVRNCRSQHRRKQRVHTRHADRKRHVTTPSGILPRC